MAKRGRPGKGQLSFDFDVEEIEPTAVTRMPRLSPMRMSAPTAKLHSTYVFTDEADAKPRPWVSVSSTRVAQIRYDDGTNQVEVVFNNGVPWVYEDVPSGVYEAFAESHSKGRFIHDVLDSYAYRRATPEETSRW